MNDGLEWVYPFLNDSGNKQAGWHLNKRLFKAVFMLTPGRRDKQFISDTCGDLWRDSRWTNRMNPAEQNEENIRNHQLLDAVIHLPAGLPSMVFCVVVWGSVVQQCRERQVHRQRQTDRQTWRQPELKTLTNVTNSCFQPSTRGWQPAELKHQTAFLRSVQSNNTEAQRTQLSLTHTHTHSSMKRSRVTQQ